MSLRKTQVFGRLFLCSLFALAGVASDSHAEPRGAVGLQGTFSDVYDRLDDHYKGGPGFNLFGVYHLSRTLDVRADYGVRFLEGEGFPLLTDKPTPDLGSHFGERTDGMRVMPFTVDLVYRFENVSDGRFWIPFFGAGLGLYDLEMSYLPAESVAPRDGGSPLAGGDDFEDEFDETRKKNIFEFGWNAKAGVHFHRTSQMFVSLEAGTHFINTHRRWTPMYDVSIGVGMTLPVR